MAVRTTFAFELTEAAVAKIGSAIESLNFNELPSEEFLPIPSVGDIVHATAQRQRFRFEVVRREFIYAGRYVTVQLFVDVAS